jgi:hypothetical protein
MARHATITNGDTPPSLRRKVRRRRRVMNRSTAGGGTGSFTGSSSGVAKTRNDLAHLMIDFAGKYNISPKTAVGMLRDLW